MKHEKVGPVSSGKSFHNFRISYEKLLSKRTFDL